MAYRFTASIYKVGINAVVDVPFRISEKLSATKGYIPVKGTINRFSFHQTLCPVRDKPYRLYVNMPMLKGGKVAIGEEATFSIEQDEAPPQHRVEMPQALRMRLVKEKLLTAFEAMTPSRQKEVNRYLGQLKTEESLLRNIDKLIVNLKATGTGTPWVYKRK